jgi:hypothetical protein
VYVLGGGEDTAQLFAADWLRRHTNLHHALDSSARILAVCAGLGPGPTTGKPCGTASSIDRSRQVMD